MARRQRRHAGFCVTEKKVPGGILWYGHRFAGYNIPKTTPHHPRKSHAVLVKYNGAVKLVRFGQQGVEGAGAKPKTEAQKKRRKSFKARHAKNIDRGPLYPAWWADLVKW